MPDQDDLFYTDQGKGFVIVLLHGFCETHEIWNNFSNALSKNFRVISVDLPGFGKSKSLKEGFSVSDSAKRVLGLLKELGVQKCIPVGHSLGGYVVLAMVDQHAEMFTGFGLFHSTAYSDTDERKISRNKVIDFVFRNGVPAFIETFIPPLFYDKSNPHIPSVVSMALKTTSETLIGYTKAMRDRPDLTQVIKNFNGPILFIGGQEDSGIIPESIKKQANLAIEPYLYILSEVAHMGMFEKESETLNLTRQFLVKASI